MRSEEPRVPLEALDPESSDPGYWMRLHRRILASASLELARRRHLRDLTVSDVVLSWSRGVVATALVAAALAGVLLMRAGEGPQPVVTGIEEALADGLDTETAAVLRSEEEELESAVTLASLGGF